MIEVLELAGVLGRWQEPSRRGGHLDSLLELGAQYEEEAAELGMAATLTGMISWFERLWRGKEDEIVHPEGIQAVTATTWHSAKGLEWPVVILTGLNFSRDPDLWSPRVSGGAVEQGEPLKGRVLRFWPWPFGRGLFGQLITGSNLEQDALNSEEGVRVSDLELEESRRLLYVGMTRAKRKLVLAHRPDKYDWLKRLSEVDALLPPPLPPGEHRLAGLGTSLIVRELAADVLDSCRQPVPQAQKWLAVAGGEISDIVTERFHSPSLQEPGPAATQAIVEELPGPHPFPSVKTDQYEALGNAVHAYLAALPSLANAPESRKLEIASKNA